MNALKGERGVIPQVDQSSTNNTICGGGGLDTRNWLYGWLGGGGGGAVSIQPFFVETRCLTVTETLSGDTSPQKIPFREFLSHAGCSKEN
jgi:hypothetical protein